MKRTNKSISKQGKEDTPKEINPLTGNPYSKHYYELQEKINTLPVKQYEAEVIKKLKENKVIILEGATGSGKTTQIPKFCLDEEICKGKAICCTQPRRVATKTLTTSARFEERRN